MLPDVLTPLFSSPIPAPQSPTPMANNLRNAVAKMCSGVVVVIELCRVRLLAFSLMVFLKTLKGKMMLGQPWE